LYPNNQTRGLVHRTINGGTNWLFQIPDTSIHISSYGFCDFVNQRNGWAYVGIHTTAGGDPIFYTSTNQTSSEIPKKFQLFQNFPNPFNPNTYISYELRVSSYVKLAVYDMTGRLITQLVNEKQNAGSYKVEFSGSGLSSGVYFYRIQISDEKGGMIYAETKKMILIK
jgi:hypothetical protein